MPMFAFLGRLTLLLSRDTANAILSPKVMDGYIEDNVSSSGTGKGKVFSPFELRYT